MESERAAEPERANPRRESAPADLKDFERIYRLYVPRVYRTCLRMVGNPADAEELTQDVFLQVFRKLDTYRGESAFSTWLHRVAVNTVLMRLRKKRGHLEVSLENVVETEEGSEMPAAQFGVDDPGLLGAVDRLGLERAIIRLPVSQRLAFVLHDVEGYSYEEIAAMTDCTVESAKYRLHSARVTLRGLLREYQKEHRRPEAEPDSRRQAEAPRTTAAAEIERGRVPDTEAAPPALEDKTLPLAPVLG
jgi:RNA polymerase sigma-70 factor (ECF subfamily)